MTKDQKYNLKKKLTPIRVDVRKLADSKLSLKSKRKLLSKPQVGDGIFTILAGTVLPTLISSLILTWKTHSTVRMQIKIFSFF